MCFVIVLAFHCIGYATGVVNASLSGWSCLVCIHCYLHLLVCTWRLMN